MKIVPCVMVGVSGKCSDAATAAYPFGISSGRDDNGYGMRRIGSRQTGSQSLRWTARRLYRPAIAPMRTKLRWADADPDRLIARAAASAECTYLLVMVCIL